MKYSNGTIAEMMLEHREKVNRERYLAEKLAAAGPMTPEQREKFHKNLRSEIRVGGMSHA